MRKRYTVIFEIRYIILVYLKFTMKLTNRFSIVAVCNIHTPEWHGPFYDFS